MKPTSMVLGEWKYLYRAVDSLGNTLDNMAERQTECTGGRTVFPQGVDWRKAIQKVAQLDEHIQATTTKSDFRFRLLVLAELHQKFH